MSRSVRELFDQLDEHGLISNGVIERQVGLDERHDAAWVLEALAYATDGNVRRSDTQDVTSLEFGEQGHGWCGTLLMSSDDG